MRIRKRKWAAPELSKCKFFIDNPTENIGKWKQYFNNDKKTYIELGCGKGNFAEGFTIKNLDKNFIAIDMKSDMLGITKRKIEKKFKEENQELKDIAILAYDIERILDIFNENDKISRVYINFCNPWPKPKHKKRRLTHTRQLEKYKVFLAENAEIHFKTDDDELFAESLEYFKEAGFEILELIYDLHKLNYTGNIITEHEKMFSEQGIKIKFLRAKKIENVKCFSKEIK